MKTKTTNIYDIITEKISSLLNKSLTDSDSQIPWICTKNGIAVNPVSKTVYDGINQLLLSYYLLEGNFGVNKWLTFKQAEQLNANIIKGSKGFQIVYYNFTYSYKGQKLSRTEFEALSLEEQKKVLINSFLNYYTVFNVSQIEGLPLDFYQIDDIEKTAFLPIEKLENLADSYIKNSGISFFNIGQNRAFYAPKSDKVVMPLKEQFAKSESYYEVLFHELTHSTGHPNRLNRKSLEEFEELDSNIEKYAFEELVAELGTAFINAKFGLDTNITNNAAYIQSWLNALNNDNKFFIKASSLAQKASNYLIETSNCMAA